MKAVGLLSVCIMLWSEPSLNTVTSVARSKIDLSSILETISIGPSSIQHQWQNPIPHSHNIVRKNQILFALAS